MFRNKTANFKQKTNQMKLTGGTGLSKEFLSNTGNSFRQIVLSCSQLKEQANKFKNLTMYVVESNCRQEKSFRDTDITKWIGKHIPISVSISSNLV